jgi:hypothetical protein
MSEYRIEVIAIAGVLKAISQEFDVTSSGF